MNKSNLLSYHTTPPLKAKISNRIQPHHKQNVFKHTLFMGFAMYKTTEGK